MSSTQWFYIRSINTGNVITAKDTLLRSQVFVTKPTLDERELWSWKGQFLVNKASGLVLDIRKGRLRLIEDTEICIFKEKPLEEAHNQLWGVRDDIVDVYGKRLAGSYIYSLCSNEWVLDIQPVSGGACSSSDNEDQQQQQQQQQVQEEQDEKLVLFPLQPIDTENQRWIFVPEGDLDLTVPIKDIQMGNKNSYFSESMTPPVSASSSPAYDAYEFPQGLTPAKRGSHSSIYSIDSFKDYHKRIYESHEPVVSDKGVAMASAYHIFQNWKLNQPDQMQFLSPSEVRNSLQSLTQKEVSKNMNLYPTINEENACLLSSRLVIQLYDQTPISP
ncbi:carbohydrate-binding module family 13 protein [Backusella circina FSU 941]|nr:carbohydrate-binding module family 13 protein [Backusella circina FSU 941]